VTQGRIIDMLVVLDDKKTQIWRGGSLLSSFFLFCITPNTSGLAHFKIL
jgi:hypothetical protein